MKRGRSAAGLTALVLAAAVLFAACARTQEKKTKIVVFAAASMTEAMDVIKDLYEQEQPEITIDCNYDSSGTLKTQIQEGAVCDVFISAAQKQMNQLDAAADPAVNTENLDFVLQGSRKDLLQNTVVLAVPEGNPRSVSSFDRLADLLESKDIFLAMGNSDVPVGQYTQLILAYYGLDEMALANDGLITYGSNVKEVTSQIAEGSVDCGVVYGTDAYSAGLAWTDTATPDMLNGTAVVYPAAVIKTGESPAEAQAFLDYLSGPEAMAVFERIGFVPAA